MKTSSLLSLCKTACTLFVVCGFFGGVAWAYQNACPTATCNGDKPTDKTMCLDPYSRCEDKAYAGCPKSDHGCHNITGDYPIKLYKSCTTGAEFCENNHCTAANFSTFCYSTWYCGWSGTPLGGACLKDDICSENLSMAWKMNTCCGYAGCDPFSGEGD